MTTLSLLSKLLMLFGLTGIKNLVFLSEKLTLPKFLDYKDFAFETDLSARAKSSAVQQASQIIRAVIEKQRRVLWVQENKKALIKNKKFSKPRLNFVQPMLSSKCCDWQDDPEGKFLGFVRLKSIGRSYGAIKIPVIKTPRSQGILQAGFSFSKRSVQTAWDQPTKPVRKGTKVLGIDQGILDIVTMSDKQVTPKTCPHGHSNSSILDKLARKTKGSKGFARTQKHRKNFINWSINQLNFRGVKEVRLEKVTNIRFKTRSSRKLSHWSNPEIRDKIIRRCEELEVPVIEQSCAYRSQRCNRCGQTRKANRKGKLYSCKNCGLKIDSDLNAAKNHEQDLPSSTSLRGRKLSIGDGFFWKPEGFFNFDGSELRVPSCYQ